ncbi:MAG: hydroxyectoine utilization dehydratase EutB [Pseudomonadota bacterium]
MTDMSLADILSARHVIAGVADRTPMLPSAHLTDRFGHEMLLKLESLQPIGAFKLRGALNAVAGLPDDTKGVTCCSTGNHGRAVAFAARRRGFHAVVCMSDLVPETKRDGIRRLGAGVRIVGKSQDDAMQEADRLSREEGFANISPFDDPRVVAGQGTIGLEMLEARPDIGTILIPLSGGGLAAGVALAARAIAPRVRLIGVSMDRGAAMAASVAAGRPVEVREVVSLADSLGGGIGLHNTMTFPMCRDLLDDIVLVTEPEIRDAMQVLFFEDRLVTEGACVVGIAALLAGRIALPGGPVATIITGRNVDMEVFARIVAGLDLTLGDLHLEGRRYAA